MYEKEDLERIQKEIDEISEQVKKLFLRKRKLRRILTNYKMNHPNGFEEKPITHCEELYGTKRKNLPKDKQAEYDCIVRAERIHNIKFDPETMCLKKHRDLSEWKPLCYEIAKVSLEGDEKLNVCFALFKKKWKDLSQEERYLYYDLSRLVRKYKMKIEEFGTTVC